MVQSEKALRITSVGEQLARARTGAVTQWLVDGVIVESGYTMIYGPPGCGKSLVSLDLAIAASEGRPWLGMHSIEQQSVLYVDEDSNNDHEMNTRLRSFGVSADNPHLHFALHNRFKITDERQRQEMIDWCYTHGVRLIICDSFARLHDLTESHADSMKIVTAAIKDYTLAGISVVVLHHASRSARSVRGSTEIESGPDAIYRMERTEENSFLLVNSKARSVGSEGVWSGCTVQVGKDAEGCLTLNSQPLEATDQPISKISKEDTKRSKIVSGVLNLLADGNEMTETALSEKLSIPGRDKDLFKAVLAEMECNGLIVCQKRGKGRYYSLAGENNEQSDEYFSLSDDDEQPDEDPFADEDFERPDEDHFADEDSEQPSEDPFADDGSLDYTPSEFAAYFG